jgi:hypothetical protein
MISAKGVTDDGRRGEQAAACAATPDSSGRHLDFASPLRKNFRKIFEKLNLGRT